MGQDKTDIAMPPHPTLPASPCLPAGKDRDWPLHLCLLPSLLFCQTIIHLYTTSLPACLLPGTWPVLPKTLCLPPASLRGEEEVIGGGGGVLPVVDSLFLMDDASSSYLLRFSTYLFCRCWWVNIPRLFTVPQTSLVQLFPLFPCLYPTTRLLHFCWRNMPAFAFFLVLFCTPYTPCTALPLHLPACTFLLPWTGCVPAFFFSLCFPSLLPTCPVHISPLTTPHHHTSLPYLCLPTHTHDMPSLLIMSGPFSPYLFTFLPQIILPFAFALHTHMYLPFVHISPWFMHVISVLHFAFCVLIHAFIYI